MDKWTNDTWLEATLVEAYHDCEDVTLPAARALVESSSVNRQPSPIAILGNGSGMGQVTESLLSSVADGADLKIVCGDIDPGLLGALRQKKQALGWSNVDIKEIDATEMRSVSDSRYDYVFGNFLYFLTLDPIASLKETHRTLKGGGIIAFTTWALSGPFALLQLAQAHLTDYPLAPPNARLMGSWNHPRYVRSQLEALGYADIAITPYASKQRAPSADDMARKMRHVLMLQTLGWGEERRDKGWELGQSIAKVLRKQQGHGAVEIESVVLLVTARKELA